MRKDYEIVFRRIGGKVRAMRFKTTATRTAALTGAATAATYGATQDGHTKSVAKGVAAGLVVVAFPKQSFRLASYTLKSVRRVSTSAWLGAKATRRAWRKGAK